MNKQRWNICSILNEYRFLSKINGCYIQVCTVRRKYLDWCWIWDDWFVGHLVGWLVGYCSVRWGWSGAGQKCYQTEIRAKCHLTVSFNEGEIISTNTEVPKKGLNQWDNKSSRADQPWKWDHTEGYLSMKLGSLNRAESVRWYVFQGRSTMEMGSHQRVSLNEALGRSKKAVYRYYTLIRAWAKQLVFSSEKRAKILILAPFSDEKTE